MKRKVILKDRTTWLKPQNRIMRAASILVAYVLLACILLTPGFSSALTNRPNITGTPTLPNELPHTITDEDLNKVLDWLKWATTQDSLDFCWKASYGRGVGTVPTCPAGTDKDASLCYPECRAGYHGVGPVCWADTPDAQKGWRDDGAFIAKPGDYGRGAGRIPDVSCGSGFHVQGIGTTASCTNVGHTHGGLVKTRDARISCRDNEERNGSLCYPKCRDGYHAAGSNLCSANCPSGWTDVGVSCTRPSYGRGAGTVMTCQAGTEYDAGLCYPPCRSGYTGVGPVCWGKCSTGWSECAAGCAKTKEECSYVTADQVIEPLLVAANVATLGVESGAIKGATLTVTVGTKVFSTTTEVGKLFLEAIKLLAEAAKTGAEGYSHARQAEEDFKLAYASDFENQTSQFINLAIYQSFSKDNALYIKTTFATKKFGEMAESEDYFGIPEKDLAIAQICDPTGITGVYRAYAKPTCGEEVPFPNEVAAKYDKFPAPGPGWTMQKQSSTAANIGVGPGGDAWFVTSDGVISEYAGGAWPQLPGSATDIAVGANGTAWMIGTIAEGGGYGIYRWNGSAWEKIPGGGVRISVGPDGNAWVVNDAGNIYKYQGGRWYQQPGPRPARDIGVGPDGNVWLIGGEAVTGGYGIYQLQGTAWYKLPDGGVRIAAGTEGEVYFVNDAGQIYEYPTALLSQQTPEKVLGAALAKDIGVGPDGSIWMVGTNEGVAGIYKWEEHPVYAYTSGAPAPQSFTTTITTGGPPVPQPFTTTINTGGAPVPQSFATTTNTSGAPVPQSFATTTNNPNSPARAGGYDRASRMADASCPPGYQKMGTGAATQCFDFKTGQTKKAKIGCSGDEEYTNGKCLKRCSAGYHPTASNTCSPN